MDLNPASVLSFRCFKGLCAMDLDPVSLLTEEIRLKIFGSPDFPSFPGNSFK